MRHFLMSKIKSMKLIFETFYFLKFIEMSYTKTPWLTQAVFYSFQFPQEVVNFLKNYHNIIWKNSGQSG